MSVILLKNNHQTAQFASKIFHHRKRLFEIKCSSHSSLINRALPAHYEAKHKQKHARWMQSSYESERDECDGIKSMALTTRSISRTILLYFNRTTPNMMNGMSRASSQSVFPFFSSNHHKSSIVLSMSSNSTLFFSVSWFVVDILLICHSRAFCLPI